MRLAGIGHAKKFQHKSEIRSDSIYWLDKLHFNQAEDDYLAIMNEFIRYLNSSCYTGIVSSEFHFSYFEIGQHYQAHRDQFSTNDHRKFSTVSYLNEFWQDGDGGELQINLADSKLKIDPCMGSTVFFKSDELLHEVLPANKPRMAIAGWLKSG